MKIVSKNPLDSSFVSLKNNDFLVKQRIAGKVAADTLVLLENLVKEKTTKSLIELDNIAGEYIISKGCSITFKGYKGFPRNICISTNYELVHGIAADYKLQEGDIVSFDLGATYEGVIADTAITCIYGQPKQEHLNLIKACEESLLKGIQAISVGKRLGCIGNAIYKSAKNNGFNVITNYGGHGIDISADGKGIPHASPFVSNKSDLNEGIRIQPGLVLAIEPMLLPSDTYTSINSDGWTVQTREIGSHFEHSVYIHEDHVEIITWRENCIYPKIINF